MLYTRIWIVSAALDDAAWMTKLSGSVLMDWTNTLSDVSTPVAELQVTMLLELAVTLTEFVVQVPTAMWVIVEPPLPTMRLVELAVPTATTFPAVVKVPVDAVVVAVPLTQKPPVVVRPVEEAVASVD